MIGYYISSRKVEINNREYTKHKFLCTHVGSLAHLNGVEALDPNGTYVEVLSTGVLNNKIEESVQPGVYVEIKYLGKKKKQDNSGDEYHNWDVGIANGVEPLNVQQGVVIGTGQSSNDEVTAAPAADQQAGAQEQRVEGQPAQAAAQTGTQSAETVVAEGDDDIPF